MTLLLSLYTSLQAFQVFMRSGPALTGLRLNT